MWRPPLLWSASPGAPGSVAMLDGLPAPSTWGPPRPGPARACPASADRLSSPGRQASRTAHSHCRFPAPGSRGGTTLTPDQERGPSSVFFLFQDGFTLFRAPREAIWPAEGLLCFYQEGSSDFGRHDHLQTGLGVLPSWAFLVAPVKNPPAMRETRDRSLGGKIPWRRA